MQSSLKRVATDCFGGLSVEAVLVLPFLFWAYVGLFTFFDAFRTQNINVKAAFTLSDLLSRETDQIDVDYVDGMNDVFDILTLSPHPTILRITVLRFDESANEHIMVWSHATAGKSDLTEGTLDLIMGHVPTMGDAEAVIVLETWMAFIPVMNVGLEPLYFHNFVVTRPRFAPQLLWDDGMS